jgi:hypothetical protein
MREITTLSSRTAHVLFPGPNQTQNNRTSVTIPAQIGRLQGEESDSMDILGSNSERDATQTQMEVV